MKRRLEELTNKQKAAVLLMIIGPESAGTVVRHLGEDHIESLTLEVARLDRVAPEQRENVINEFYEIAVAQDYIAEGGVEHARMVLESAFGADRAGEVIKRI